MGKINKFLCERFDFEDKGYVTIGDFIKGIIYRIIAISIITIIIYSVFKFISRGIIYNNEEIPSMISFYMLGGTIVILIAVFVIILVIATIVTLIEIGLNIKIAECELKIKHEIKPDSLSAKYSMRTIPFKTEMEEKI